MNVLFLPKSPNSANNFKAGQNKSVSQNNPGLKLSFKNGLEKHGCDYFEKLAAEQKKSLEKFSLDCLEGFIKLDTESKKFVFNKFMESFIEYDPHTVNQFRKFLRMKPETKFDWENEVYKFDPDNLTKHTAEDFVGSLF